MSLVTPELRRLVKELGKLRSLVHSVITNSPLVNNADREILAKRYDMVYLYLTDAIVRGSSETKIDPPKTLLDQIIDEWLDETEDGDKSQLDLLEKEVGREIRKLGY